MTVVALISLTVDLPPVEPLLTRAGWRTRLVDITETIDRIVGPDWGDESGRDRTSAATRTRLALLHTVPEPRDSLELAALVERSIARYRRLGVPVIVIAPRETRLAARQLLMRAMASGADDFVTAAALQQEFLLRLEALTWRRKASREQRIASICGMVIDRASRRLSYGDRHETLSPCEFRLFSFLARHHGETISRASIRHHLAPHSRAQTKNLVDVYILYLRRKLGRLQPPCAIRTVRGVGYALVSTSTTTLPPGNWTPGAVREEAKSLAS